MVKVVDIIIIDDKGVNLTYCGNIMCERSTLSEYTLIIEATNLHIMRDWLDSGC